jgi:hypothetical protein
MFSITRKCDNCKREKPDNFFSNHKKYLCLSCYDEAISEESLRKITNSRKYVYIIGGVGSSLVKIGITKQLSQRLFSLNTSSPIELFFVFHFLSENAMKTEKELHKKFSTKRVKGEWFALTEQDIEQIKYKYSSSN